jgi:hypothetical protein
MHATLPGVVAPPGGAPLPPAESPPRGLPPLPWPALTPEQREHATALLQAYLTDHYRLRHPYAKPEYVMQHRRFLPGELPDGYGAGDVPRHGKGSHDDPTYRRAREAIEGPDTVAMEMPYFVRLPWEAMTVVLSALPTHLLQPIGHAYMDRRHYVRAGEMLGISYRTVGRRCLEGLETLGLLLYGDRWGARP